MHWRATTLVACLAHDLHPRFDSAPIREFVPTTAHIDLLSRVRVSPLCRRRLQMLLTEVAEREARGFSGSSFAPVGRLTVEIAIASPRAVHRDFESRADGTHPRIGEPAKPIHQHPDRDAFD